MQNFPKGFTKEDFFNLYQKLQIKIEELELKVSMLETENLALKEENRLLREENKLLREENNIFREKLGLNSTNSSIPSSKELYKIKKERRTRSNLFIGGQLGHKGAIRIKESVDEIIEIPLSDICSCGGEIKLSLLPHIHRKVDIPEIKPHVIEYHLQRGKCSRCGKKVKSRLPEGVSIDLFGPRVKTVISSLTGFFKNSKREVLNIARDIFKLNISLGTISNSERRVAKKCQDRYEQLKEEVTNSEILHIDETSHYNKGKLGWCWMFTNNQISVISLCDSRGKKILEKNIPEYTNTVITDRYSAYNYFPEENRQICWAHLSRDFERFASSYNIEVKKLGLYLSDIAKELFTLKKALKSEEITELIFISKVKKLRKKVLRYLNDIRNLTAATQASRVAKNLIKSEAMMWKFLDNPNLIPLTNNHAERQIRHYVVYRKNSYFTWSKRGEEFLESIISLYFTWKQRGENPFDNLLSLN